jgi:hypothetical protein
MTPVVNQREVQLVAGQQSAAFPPDDGQDGGESGEAQEP